jgi:thiamine biosynthesis lipoprotein
MRRVLIPLAIAPAGPVLGAAVHALSGRSMGTTWSVRWSGHPRSDTARIQAALQARLDRVVAQMSHWEPDSDLARFNRAPAGCWQTLPEPFFSVLQQGLAIAAASDGAYDPAAGALVDLWGFGPTGRYDQPDFAPPDAAAVRIAASGPRWRDLQLDMERRAVRQPGGARLDLSAIAKGFAVDDLAACLEQHGIADYLVEIGGELRGHGGKPDGQPWWVALESPTPAAGQSPLGTQTVVALHGLSVATSGDYRRFYQQHGLRRAHTIDPRSGWPIEHGLASVTVLHETCLAADAWSTALTAMGPQEGAAAARAHGLAALFVTRHAQGWTEVPSPALQALLQ